MVLCIQEIGGARNFDDMKVLMITDSGDSWWSWVRRKQDFAIQFIKEIELGSDAVAG